MLNQTIDSYSVRSKVIDSKTFINLDERERKMLKTTRIIPPNHENPFGAIEIIYKYPQIEIIYKYPQYITNE